MNKAYRWGILFVVCVAAAGCGKRESSQGTKESAEKPFVVAIPTYPGFAVPYLAKEKGLFAGLNVDLKRIDDAAAINAGLIRGDIDACFTSVDSFVLAAAQGVEAKAVLMSDESRGADGIVAKQQIKDVADLKGKKVAANLGWPGHFFLLYNLQRAGVPFSAVPITNMDADKAGAAFVSGNLDAAVTWEPWLSRATSGGTGKILVSTKTLPGVILDVMLVRQDTLSKRPQAVQSFVDGYYKALKAYGDDKQASAAVMAKAVGLEPADFEAMTAGFRFIPADEAAKMLEPKDGAVPKLFGEAAAIWLKGGVIDKAISSERRSDNQFVERYVGGK
jgi:NitT/TauT family transport system substrate-binding protein